MKLKLLIQFIAMIWNVSFIFFKFVRKNFYLSLDTAFNLFIALTVLETNPHKFRIFISTEEYNQEEESNGLSCRLVFTYTEKYPDTAPLVEVEDAVNFEDDYEAKLLEHINETVEIV